VAARRDSVQSVERALDLLEVLAADGELGVTDLAAATGLVPSTVHRLLATLGKRAWVTQSADSSRYRLGYKVVELASRVGHNGLRLRDIAHPHLERVQQATGETVNLVVLDGERVVYLDQVEGTRSVRMFTTLGAAALAHSTAAGKAIMAYGPEDAVETLYDGRESLERLTARTLTTVAELKKDFKRIRDRGYATDNEEHEEGVGCVAVPVFDGDGKPRGAISVSAPAARILHSDTGELASGLLEHAAEISAALGHEPEAE